MQKFSPGLYNNSVTFLESLSQILCSSCSVRVLRISGFSLSPNEANRTNACNNCVCNHLFCFLFYFGRALINMKSKPNVSRMWSWYFGDLNRLRHCNVSAYTCFSPQDTCFSLCWTKYSIFSLVLWRIFPLSFSCTNTQDYLLQKSHFCCITYLFRTDWIREVLIGAEINLAGLTKGNSGTSFTDEILLFDFIGIGFYPNAFNSSFHNCSPSHNHPPR